METVQIEQAVYEKLIGDTLLTDMLSDGADSVFHMQAPSDLESRYPALVYSVISDVPAIVGDDSEITHRVSMRVHILTLDGDYGGIYRRVCADMSELNFSRYQAYPYIEEGQIIMIADYRIGVDSEWQQSD